MRRPDARSAFTIVELTVTVAVLAVLFTILGLILSSSATTFRIGSLDMDVESRGSRLLRRVVDAARAADDGTLALVPTPPLSTSQIDYQVRTPFDGTQTGLGPPTRIQLVLATGEVRRTESPGLPGQRTDVLGRGVAALLEGEVANGLDDNGNGLVDEPGLCFTREGSVLRIRLTLQGDAGAGRTAITRTWETSLQCRN